MNDLSRWIRMIYAGLGLLATAISAHAATSVANDPFVRTGNLPPPNIMVGFDNSGSMGVTFLPMGLNDPVGANTKGACRQRSVQLLPLFPGAITNRYNDPA